MVERLIGAISKSIREKWGNGYEVYTESVYQGAEKPCFFVECEKSERVELLNYRYLVRVTVKITCHVDSDEKNLVTDEMLGDMFDILGVVECDGLYFNGRKIHGKREDGAFVSRACYDIWTQRSKEEAVCMGEIHTEEIIDGR